MEMLSSAFFKTLRIYPSISLISFCLTLAVSNKVSDSNKVIALESSLLHQILQTLHHLLRACRMK